MDGEGGVKRFMTSWVSWSNLSPRLFMSSWVFMNANSQGGVGEDELLLWDMIGE